MVEGSCGPFADGEDQPAESWALSFLALHNVPAALRGAECGWGVQVAPLAGGSHHHAVPLCRFVIQLLEDLVFFVSDVPNNGQNVLDIVVTKPNRERQKLMREQNILKQVSGPGAVHPRKADVLRGLLPCPEPQ